MSTALWPIQVAAATRLKANGPLVALVGQRIYDGRAPQSTSTNPTLKPYVIVGEGTELPDDVFGGTGVDDTITLHVFSGGPVPAGQPEINSRQQALAIVAAMDAAFLAPLTITGWGSAEMRPDFVTVLVEPDGTRHAPRRYRILAHVP